MKHRPPANGATATSALKDFSMALNRMPLVVRKNVTCDQEREQPDAIVYQLPTAQTL